MDVLHTGSGPTGSYKHIAALCYTLEDFTCVHQLRSHVSCTSQLQMWNQPRKRHLDATDVNKIKFAKMENGKEKRVPKVVPYDPCPLPLQGTSAVEVHC